MSNVLRTRLQTSRVFLLSSLSGEQRKEYGKIIQQLGGIYFDSESFKASCTHLVCGKLSRSEKFLGACATGKWILRPEYIVASNDNKDWLPEDEYEWHPSCGKSAQSEPLIFAPSRCRLHFSLTSEPSFKGWKVSVLVSDKKRALVYKRLLTSGGAQLYSLKMPVKDPLKVANTITFIFTDKKMAAPLMEQALMEYGLLLLKPEFIGDYLIHDPHPDPMDYLVSVSSSPDLSGDRSLFASSQESDLMSSQSVSQNSASHVARRSLVLDEKIDIKLPSQDSSLKPSVAKKKPPRFQESKRSSRLRALQGSMEAQLSKQPLGAQSQESANITANSQSNQAAATIGEDSSCRYRNILPLEISEADTETPSSSQGSWTRSRKLLKAKRTSNNANLGHSQKIFKENKGTKGMAPEDENFMSVDRVFGSSNDKRYSQGSKRISRQLARVDPFIEYTSKCQESSSQSQPTKESLKLRNSSSFIADTFVSLETASVGSDVSNSSQGSQRLSTSLARTESIGETVQHDNRKTVTDPDSHFFSRRSRTSSNDTTSVFSSQSSKRMSMRLAKTKSVAARVTNQQVLLDTGISEGNTATEPGTLPVSKAHVESHIKDSAAPGSPKMSISQARAKPTEDIGLMTVLQDTFDEKETHSLPVSQSSKATVETTSADLECSSQRSQRRTRSSAGSVATKMGISEMDSRGSRSQGSKASVETVSVGSEAKASSRGPRRTSKRLSECKTVDDHTRLSDTVKGDASNEESCSLSKGSGRPLKRARKQTSKSESVDSQYILFVSDADSDTIPSTPQFKRISKQRSTANLSAKQKVTNRKSEERKVISDTNNIAFPEESKESISQVLPGKRTDDSVRGESNRLLQKSNSKPPISLQESRRSFIFPKLGSSQETSLKTKSEDSVESMKDVIIILSDCEASVPHQKSKSATGVRNKCTDLDEKNITSPPETEKSCIVHATEVKVKTEDELDSSLVRIPRSRSGSLKQIRSKSKSDQKSLRIKSLSDILSSEVGNIPHRSSRNSSPVTFSTDASVIDHPVVRKEELTQSHCQGTPRKSGKVSRSCVNSPSSSQASPRKLSQSSLQDFGFSSATKRRTRSRFSRLLSKKSSRPGSPVSLSQGSGSVLPASIHLGFSSVPPCVLVGCSQTAEEPKESMLSSFVTSREEALDQDAFFITNSIEKMKIDKTVNENEVQQTKTETPTNNLMVQSCGAKRKIFEDDVDMADGVKPIVKKMKLSQPVQSWNPFPLGIKVDQLKGEPPECTVTSQMPNSVCNLINSCLEEDFQQEALMFMQSSSQMYPSPQTLHTVMTRVLLKAKSVRIAQTAYRVLMNSLSIHPPITKVMKDVYQNAFSLQEEGQGEGIWGFVSSVISGALCGENSEVDDSQDKCSLLLQFLVAAFRHNFHSFLAEMESNNHGKSRNIFRSCMLLQCLWYPSYMMFPNARTQQLLAYLEQCLLLPSEYRYKVQVLESILGLVSMAAQCCQAADNKRLTNSYLALGERTSLFVSDLARKIAGSCIEDEAIFLTTLRNLQPNWLCLKICQILLGNLDDYLLVIRPDNGFLTLTKIVTQYFFLLPRLSRRDQEDEETNKMDTRRKRGRSSKSNVPKMDTVEDTKEMAAKINKRNHLGETLLHGACIKNDVPKLKQLLKVPGIDVNAQDNAGWTPLHEACNKGHIDCVEALLKYIPVRTVESYFKTDGISRRVDLLAANSDGVTPLHDAVVNNRLDVCRLLLKHAGQSLLKVQTKQGQYPKDLASTPSMFNLLTTPPTPNEQREDDISSSQDSVNSPGHHRTDFLPSAVLYDQVLGQDGCPMTASIADCRHYIIMVTFLLQSYIRSSQLLTIQSQCRRQRTSSSFGLPSLEEGTSNVTKESQVPNRVARRTCRPAKLSSYVCGKGKDLDKETTSDCEKWNSIKGDDVSENCLVTAKLFEEDLSVFRRLRHHLKNFSLHISKISSSEDFKLLEMRLSCMNICAMAASKSK